jgi:hypothetical protein
VSVIIYNIKRFFHIVAVIKVPLNIFQEAECEKSAMDIKYNTDTKIEDNSRMYKLQKANFDKEINTAVSI